MKKYSAPRAEFIEMSSMELIASGCRSHTEFDWTGSTDFEAYGNYLGYNLTTTCHVIGTPTTTVTPN